MNDLKSYGENDFELIVTEFNSIGMFYFIETVFPSLTLDDYCNLIIFLFKKDKAHRLLKFIYPRDIPLNKVSDFIFGFTINELIAKHRVLCDLSQIMLDKNKILDAFKNKDTQLEISIKRKRL
ncbi:Uncharacterised protein [Yersinia enterocolitica]|uniref:hypothetical protein n=1 Tax=Yersinia enterocolitica TaxID=630 RepID=UPI0005E7390C|nr:hypothetical protein [Yersinia enterocolitica]CNG68880.1 Uncharacterised protein [Yersinia enterocolitica]